MSSAGLKRFKLLRGIHNEKGVTYTPGDGKLIETTIDLNEKLDPEGIRFERVQEYAPISDTHEDNFEALTIDGLKNLAAEEEIDLGDATKKADIIAIVREKLSAKE